MALNVFNSANDLKTFEGTTMHLSSKKFLVARKTNLTMLYIFEIVSAIVTLIRAIINSASDLFVPIEEIDVTATKKFVMITCIVNIVMDICAIVLLQYARTNWANFRRSVFYTKSIGITILINIVILLLVPVKIIFSTHCSDKLLEIVTIEIILPSTLLVVVVANIIIYTTLALIRRFPEMYEYTLMMYSASTVYVPLCMVAIFVLFQIATDYLLLITSLGYVVITCLMIRNKLSNIVAGYISLSIIIIVSTLYIVFVYNFNILILDIDKYFILYIVIEDFLNSSLATYRSTARVDTDFNVFLKDLGYIGPGSYETIATSENIEPVENI
jgi:hypothetical protein